MNRIDSALVNLALVTGSIAVGGIIGKIICRFFYYLLFN
jgi:hypothetical protein